MDWIKSYLINRQQTTVIDHISARPRIMDVGVPQGSILGPLLFLIFINDLPTRIQSCETTLYANDTLLYYASPSVIDLENKINSDLCNVATWLENNFLTLNVEKSEFILIGSPYKLKTCENVNITIQGSSVKCTNSIKYLGIKINQNLSCSYHVEDIIKKCNQRIGILRRV